MRCDVLLVAALSYGSLFFKMGRTKKQQQVLREARERKQKSESFKEWAAPSPSTPSEEEVEDDDVPDLMTDAEEILDPLQLNQNGKVRGDSKRSQERKKAKERKKAAEVGAAALAKFTRKTDRFPTQPSPASPLPPSSRPLPPLTHPPPLKNTKQVLFLCFSFIHDRLQPHQPLFL